MPQFRGVLSIKRRRDKVMPIFRTKPRTVEAVQWLGQPMPELPLWAQDPRYVEWCETHLFVYTRQGPVRVNRSDWLIQGDKEVYPCANDIFQERYEAVE